MHRKLTIIMDEGLSGSPSGRGTAEDQPIHRDAFIETLVRPHVIREDLMAAYRDMAGEEEREAEAHAWAEATLGDVADETR